jgi:hypothetical protein
MEAYGTIMVVYITANYLMNQLTDFHYLGICIIVLEVTLSSTHFTILRSEWSLLSLRMQRHVVHRRFETNILSAFSWSRNKSSKNSVRSKWQEKLCLPSATSIYPTARRNITEDSIVHGHRCDDLESNLRSTPSTQIPKELPKWEGISTKIWPCKRI